MSATVAPAHPDDRGLSLIELIVVVVLVGTLSGVIVMILVNSWNTQKDVNSTTTATNAGQVFGSSLERAVRNADAIVIESIGTDSVVRVHTILGGQQTCQAFRIGPGLHEKVGGAATLVSSSGSLTWRGPFIPNNVSTSGAPFSHPAPPGDPTGTPDPRTIDYAFEIETDVSPIHFSGSVSARNALTGDISTCY